MPISSTLIACGRVVKNMFQLLGDDEMQFKPLIDGTLIIVLDYDLTGILSRSSRQLTKRSHRSLVIFSGNSW